MKILKKNINYDLYNQGGQLVAKNVCKLAVLKIYDSFDFPDENIKPSKSKSKVTWFSDEVTLYYPELKTNTDLGYYDLTSGKETKFDSFLEEIGNDLIKHKKHNKRTVEKIAATYGITNKNIVKETTELAIVKIARSVAAQKNKSDYDKYLEIVDLYKHQVNLSHRTSQSMLLQQYSTPAPIGYIGGLYILKETEDKTEDFYAPKNYNYDEEGNLIAWSKGKKRKEYYAPKGYSYDEKGNIIKIGEPHFFEPSAGNGLLTIALPIKNTIVNEIDDIRLQNLRTQDFEHITSQDATIPFTDYYKKFDGVITNPPFGTLLDAVIYDGYKIKTLDHLMALRALDTMKDNGKAAIIIGGHTNWDDKGRIQAGKNRLFFNYLYSHYNIDDVILIDGHKLYSRQGTAFDVRLILIDGRKEKTEGFAPLKNPEAATVINNFEDLWFRVFGFGKKRNKRLRKILSETSEETKQKVSKYADNLVKHNEKLMKVKRGDTIFDNKGSAVITKKHKPKENTPSYEAEKFLVDIKRANGHKTLNMPLSQFTLHQTDKQNRIRIAKAKAQAKIKLLNLLNTKNLKGISGDFGPVFRRFKNKPKEAIKHLLKVKEGDCINALYRDDIGYIDIVWGENDKNNKGFGLKHIIEKHGKDIEQIGFKIESFIPIVVQFGEFNEKKSDTDKKVFESKMFRFVIAMDNKRDKRWLLTAFDLRKKPGINRAE